jgi:hypothetical protein
MSRWKASGIHLLPADQTTRLRIMSTALQGKDLQLYRQYYVPYEQEVGECAQPREARGPAWRATRSGAGELPEVGEADRRLGTLRSAVCAAAQLRGIADAACGAVLKILLVDSTAHGKARMAQPG